MRLYRMELYKLCHRKIFIIGSGCVIAILLFFFLTKIWEEETYVDGVTYRNYQAIRMNRQVTEEFKGVMTDGKAEKIIERYGFPQKAEDYRNFYVDSNFVTRWVTNYMSDGYYNHWGDYQIPTSLLPFAETDLQEIKEVTGGDIILEYSDGWMTFADFLTLGMTLGSILILFGISIVFANEGQTKMLPLLFTTKEGKKKDIFAKIAAAFTVSVLVWLTIVMLDFILCGFTYGFDGLKCLTGLSKIIRFMNLHYRPISAIPISSFLVIVLCRSFLGIMLLCAITIFISACYQSSFHAVIIAFLCWMLPILLWFLFANIGGYMSPFMWLFIYASPLYLVRYDALIDSYGMWVFLAWLAAAGMLIGSIGSYRKYKKYKGI